MQAPALTKKLIADSRVIAKGSEYAMRKDLLKNTVVRSRTGKRRAAHGLRYKGKYMSITGMNTTG